MKSICFLDLSEILDIHQDQINRYGGEPGVRDVGLLQSAIAMPQAGFGDEYFHKDLAEMASAYLFHIVCNHPFIEGNKRAGSVSAAVFLKMNGLKLNVANDALVEFVLSVAQSKTDKSKVAEWIRKNIKKS